MCIVYELGTSIFSEADAMGMKARPRRKPSPASRVSDWLKRQASAELHLISWSGRACNTLLVIAEHRAGTGESPRSYAPMELPRSAISRDQLEDTLIARRGNVSAAARALGVSRIHAHRLIRRYGIDTTEIRRALLAAGR
jgi:transcriptional regulator of acetoin/glycerol metabolism